MEKTQKQTEVKIGLPPEETEKITAALTAIKQLFPEKQGIYNLEAINSIKFAVLDVLHDLFSMHPKIIKTQDIAPILTYHGRQINIESKTGVSRDTEICIDGKPLRYCRAFALSGGVEGAVVFKTEVLDINV